MTCLGSFSTWLINRRALRHSSLLCLGLLAGLSQAQQINAITSNPDLFLTLIDQTNAQLSYTLNLNVKAADFYINAQQDAGSYLFFTLDPTKDAALQAFVAAEGAALTNTRWAVMGMNIDTGNVGQRVMYSTLTNNGLAATQTANYDKLFNSLTNGTFRQNSILPGYIAALNNGIPGTTIQLSSLNSSTTFGSSLSNISYPSTYAGKSNGFNGGTSSTDGDCVISSNVCVFNPIGVSSWFYQTSVSKNSAGSPNGNLTKVAVDEFDNLTNDGYWGFARNTTTGLYVLSYTLPGSNPKSLVSTEEGRTRLSFTDYSAQSGTARLISLGDADIANIGIPAGTIAAVPEPQTWGLMALGGLLVGGAARRRAASVQGV